MNNFKDRLKLIRENYDSLLIIHYSSYRKQLDEDKAYSSRVTSIAVLHPSSSTMHSFSLNLVAEQLGIPWADIESRYDEIESAMLQSFYAFVRENAGALWVHWKMSNVIYGFQSIAHRYTVLTHEAAPTIPDSKRINLAGLIERGYGRNYVDHPLMYNVMKLNGPLHKDTLTGEQEVQAFEQKELKKLHASNMSKVYQLNHLLELVLTGKLKTQRSNLSARINALTEHPWAKLLGFIGILFTIVQVGMLVQSLLDAKTSPKPSGSPIQGEAVMPNPAVQGTLRDKAAPRP